jgi:anti-sigma factor RsiW
MMTCRQTSRLLSEALDRDLSAEEREEVQRHLAVCRACTRCHGQFEELRQALRRMATA